MKGSEINVFAPSEVSILHSPRCFQLCEEYERMFGEPFMCFNMVDFRGTGEKPAAQVYLETIEESIQTKKSFHIKSKRYDAIDH